MTRPRLFSPCLMDTEVAFLTLFHIEDWGKRQFATFSGPDIAQFAAANIEARVLQHPKLCESRDESRLAVFCLKLFWQTRTLVMLFDMPYWKSTKKHTHWQTVSF
jgi:hypothetical protein